ncbi:DUF3572 domain-containing protein [Sphingobium sufflavum]|uniref:DUF3572 domain-containing protein n=1 Tax=Sphingobium sufflavum TaxID=1129547 RepID=UPI001F262548|nr:DUF3572 domain-containing protein [Sphingobium sufflavum]MCE7795516.1 DUF3572 domain-containing protein [Sphingobium sufflavum]
MIKPLYSKSGDGHTIALLVIGWIVAEPGRVERFLTLTGMDSDQLRGGLGDAAVLGAAIDFLLSHEPDLLACADAIGESPAAIVAARAEIG